MGRTGRVSGTKREVLAASANAGHFVHGPYAIWPEGDARATFNLNIDVVDTNNDDVAIIDIHDATTGNILASRTLSRQDFGDHNRPQDFDLFFTTQGLPAHKFEVRVASKGNSYIAFHQARIEVDAYKGGLPKIVNMSDSSQERVEALLVAAIAGMGFQPANGAPSAKDIVFVGKWYMAWVDQTGFGGKVNGLWQLNGAAGTELDFVLKKDNRPLNFLIPGEAGNGEWGGSYVGAEHYELPSWVQEPGTTCPNGTCNWFAYNEAPKMIAKTPGISLPHWSACNGVKPGFHKIFPPISVKETADSVELWYEDRLVKMADNTDSRSGKECGLDYLFQDGQRRPIFLQTGYKFYKNNSIVDRFYRYRNPAENPTFSPRGYVIGGFVITDLNNKIPEKAFYNQYRWTNGRRC